MAQWACVLPSGPLQHPDLFLHGGLRPPASRLQAFLGVPGEGGGCTSRLDGRKVLSSLQTIQGLLVAPGGASSPGQAAPVHGGWPVHSPWPALKQPFVQGLSSFAPITLPRSLDLSTGPNLAAEKISRFMHSSDGVEYGQALGSGQPRQHPALQRLRPLPRVRPVLGGALPLAQRRRVAVLFLCELTAQHLSSAEQGHA